MRPSRPQVALFLLVGLSGLGAAARVHAQPAGPEAADAGAPADEQWSQLAPSTEPDKPEQPVPPAPPPRSSNASPYRPAAPSPATDRPAPQPAPPPAATDDESSEAVGWMRRWRPHFANRSVRADWDVSPTDAGTTMSWDVVARLGVEDVPVYLDVDIPWAYSTASGADQVVFGNPTVGVHGGDVVGKVVAIWGGAVVAIPTLFAGNPAELATTQLASLLRAGAEAHRFTAEHVPLRLLTGIEVQIHPLIYARAELAPTFFIPTKDAQARADASGTDAFFAMMDQLYEIEALSPAGVGGGVRFQAVLEITHHTADRAQTALEPYVSYHPPPEGPFAVPVFARLGLLFALDQPLGFGFERNKLATLRTSIGVSY